MQQTTILWADDEIDLLKPHLLFLKEKGYDVTPVNSGADAIEEIQEKSYDLVFLDENMPGLTGLQTLTEIKAIRPTVPVVMITKSEEEHIMESAIGAKIADYLIKPVNPSQILLSVKKVLDNKRLVSEATNSGYQRDFRQLGMQLSDRLTPAEWADVYKKLVYWELEINETEGKSMAEVFNMQKDEANTYFGRFITEDYEDWVNGDDKNAPLMSHQLFKERVFPTLKATGDTPVYFVLIDNLRYDQWKVLEPIITELFTVDSEEMYYAILPTTTAYARNAIFSGMMPSRDSEEVPQSVGGRPGRRGQKPARGRVHGNQLPEEQPEGEALLPQGDQPAGRQGLAGQDEQPAQQLQVQRHRVQLRGHALARPHRHGHDSRAGGRRVGLPQHHPLVVPALAAVRDDATDCREKGQAHHHHRPRHHPLQAPLQDCGRPQHQHQPALQARQKPGLRRLARRVRGAQAGITSSCREKT